MSDERGYSLGDIKCFGELAESFGSYSSSRLNVWQEEALEEHGKALRRLEDYCSNGKEIPENFVKLIL